MLCHARVKQVKSDYKYLRTLLRPSIIRGRQHGTNESVSRSSDLFVGCLARHVGHEISRYTPAGLPQRRERDAFDKTALYDDVTEYDQYATSVFSSVSFSEQKACLAAS